MRTAYVIVGLACGCNQVFDIRSTAPLDAAYFDAPIDAPFTCPPIGAPPPKFSRTVQQEVVQDCREPTRADESGWRAALCTEPSSGPAVSAPGEVGFTPIALLATVGFVRFDQPRLAPEGDELFVRRAKTDTSNIRVDRYHRSGDTWSGPDILIDPADIELIIGQPSKGPVRRMMTFSGGTLTELEIPASGSPTTVTQYGPSELGVTNLDQYPANLSADGLRMVFIARRVGQMSQEVLYTDRTTLADRFRPGVAIEGVPYVTDAVLTLTCDRIYFSALQSIFYEQQL